jgi:GTP-binding nuclear protein Ran
MNGMGNSKSMILKLCLLGDGGVGKSTLAERLASGIFNSETKITIGVDFQLIPIHLNLKDNDENQMRVDVAIWDLGGESQFREILPAYINGADGGLLLYDTTRYKTVNDLIDWVKIWRENTHEGIPLYLVGSKIDNVSEINTPMLIMNRDDLRKDLNIDHHFFISSKTGHMVHEVINLIVKEMVEQKLC